MNTVGDKIKEYRLMRGMTQQDIADALGESSGRVIYNWEKGIGRPDCDKLARLCDLLGVSADELIGCKSMALHPTAAEWNTLQKYRALDEHGKEIVDYLIESEYKRVATTVRKPKARTFYAEAALSLQNEGYGVERHSDEHLLVSLDGKPLCEVTNTTGITYRQENISSPEREAAKDKAYEIVRAVGEYTRQMQSAPKLEVPGLSNQYKLLADFNGTVLAGMESRYGMQFVTWDWDFDRKGLSHGHYYGNNYIGAKQDFATRSGLMDRQRLFTDEQLIEIYRCCEDTLEDTYELTAKQRKCIEGVQDQIKDAIPDVLERIKLHDQQALEQEQQMTQTM